MFTILSATTSESVVRQPPLKEQLLGMGALANFCEASHEQLKSKCSTCFMPKGAEPSSASSNSANPLPQNTDLPPVLLKDKKKPFVAPPRRVSKSGLKKPPLENCYFPPGNGLLVPELIPVAHAVFEARETLLQLVVMLMGVVPVKVCKFCDHSHVGPIGHDIATCEGQGSPNRHGRHVWKDGCVEDVVSNLTAYHSQDRLKLIRDNDKRALKRLPAVVELCIQAGVDLPGYPVVRNMRPVRGSGRIKILADDIYSDLLEDLELWGEEEEALDDDARSKAPSSFSRSSLSNESHVTELGKGRKMNSDWKFEEVLEGDIRGLTLQSSEKTKQVAEMALRLWEVMKSGAQTLMTRYTVRACGYCPEVHIGPRGHMVRLCGAFKHEYRRGQHGWQAAGLDDLIPPKYVWHVPDLKNPLLLNESRNFYGQAPAVVELCVQAGAEIPDKYGAMMRLDVVTPTCYEAGTAI